MQAVLNLHGEIHPSLRARLTLEIEIELDVKGSDEFASSESPDMLQNELGEVAFNGNSNLVSLTT